MCWESRSLDIVALDEIDAAWKNHHPPGDMSDALSSIPNMDAGPRDSIHGHRLIGFQNLFMVAVIGYMGNQSSVFYLYGRLSGTDRWEGQPLHAMKLQPLGKFKHAVFALGLRRRFIDYGKIYLYHGRSRMIRCEIVTDDENFRTLELTFASPLEAEEFTRAQESLFGTSGGWLTEEFNTVYKCIDGGPLTRRYVTNRPVG